LWVIIVLASLILVIILLLCVPFDFIVHIDTEARPRLSMNLKWFFGLVNKKIEKGRKRPGKAKKTRPEKKLKSPIDKKFFFKVLKIKGLFTQVKRLLKDSAFCIKIKELAINLTICPDNAADTGVLFALATPLRIFTDSFYPCKINISPVFESDSIIRGDFSGALRLQPIRLMIPTAKFFFSLPVLRLLGTFITSKWKKEK
jgi:hypothetical protein